MNSLYLQYPNDWEKIPLRKSLLKFDSGDWGDKPEKENEGYIVIRSTDFDELGRIVYDKSVKRIIDEQTINKKHLKEGDILLNKSSGSDKHIGKIIYFKTTLNEKHHFSNFIQRLRTDHKKIINKYLYYFLSSEYGQMSTSRFIQTSSGLKNIDLKGYSKQKIPVPPLVEQRGIAEVLGCVDECIRLTDEVIGAAEELKRGLMQRLLTQGIGHTEYKQTPLGKIPKTWKIVKINQIADTFSGGTPSREKSEYYKGNIHWIKSGELNQDEIFETEEYITERALNESSAKMVSKNTLLMAMYGATAGQVAITRIDASINQAIAAIVPEKKFTTTEFLYYYLQFYINRIISKTQGSGQPNLSQTVIKKIEITLPPLSEQQKIVSILVELDKRLRHEVKYNKKIKEIKQGLMQILLSGKVRVELREDGLHRVEDSRETHN